MDSKPTIIVFSAFYDPWMSGAERFVKEVVERQAGRYHFVLFTARLSRRVPAREQRGEYEQASTRRTRGWTSKGGPTSGEPLVSDGARGEYEIRRLGFGCRADKWLYPLLAPLSAWRVREARLVHAAMESYAGIALWLYSFLRPRAPRVLTLQSGDLDEKAKQGRFPGWLWTRIHRSPDYVTAISNFLAARAKRLRGADSELDVAVLPNGVDLANIPQAHDRVAGRIVCVARLSPEKGIEHLLRALSEVRQKVPEAHLVLVGDGPEREKLENLAQELGVESVVTFRGRLENKQTLEEISRASVFVCPSLAEGLGIVFIEAQAVGVPVVGTNVGGIPDVIEDGVTGILVPSGESQPLAAAIVRMLTDQQFVEECVHRARERLARFDWQRITDEMGAIYHRFLSERRILIAAGIYPPEIGGPATYVKTIAPSLVKNGWRAVILTYGDKSTESAPPEVGRKIVWRRVPAGLRHAVYATEIFRLGRRSDVIYLQDHFSVGLPTMIANLFLRRRTVLKIVGDYAWEQGQTRFGVRELLDKFSERRYGLAVELLRFIERWVVRRADQIIVPSEYLKRIVHQWIIPEDRISVIPNAVTINPQRPTPSAQSPTIVTSGRLLPWKGMRELVAALPSIQKVIPEAKLQIVGDGPERSRIEEDIRRLGLYGAVEMTGRLPKEEVAGKIAAAGVFVLYSGYEGFSHQLIEAMAGGVPVVCSSAGGNAEVARDGENALVVRYGDGPALVAAITRALTDAELSVRLATAARETAEKYTLERMMQGLIAELDLLCPSRFS